MMAPAAHHASLTRSVEMLIRLGRAGIPGLMSEDCVAGACARASFDEARTPMPAGVDFTTIYSRRDGIVDWRACIDPLAHAVEVTASHTGMAFDPRVADARAGRPAGDRREVVSARSRPRRRRVASRAGAGW